jgi:HEPN domain-containing protein
MSVPPETIEILRQWVEKAEHDLEAARRIMIVEEGCPYDTACFHCQPAAEKYLKALLTLLGIQAPRSHDLEKLARLLPAGHAIAVSVSDLAALNPYAVEVRYAGDWQLPQREDAMFALDLAVRIRTSVLASLPQAAQ